MGCWALGAILGWLPGQENLYLVQSSRSSGSLCICSAHCPSWSTPQSGWSGWRLCRRMGTEMGSRVIIHSSYYHHHPMLYPCSVVEGYSRRSIVCHHHALCFIFLILSCWLLTLCLLSSDVCTDVPWYKISTVSYTKAVIRLSSEMMWTMVYNAQRLYFINT